MSRHPARELWHAFTLTFRSLKSLIVRYVPGMKPRAPKPPQGIGIQSPVFDSMEQGQAWATCAPDIWFVKRWERRTRRMCWIQGASGCLQFTLPYIFGSGYLGMINVAVGALVLLAHDQSVRVFAAARASLLQALEEHPNMEARWYDESKLLSRRDAA